MMVVPAFSVRAAMRKHADAAIVQLPREPAGLRLAAQKEFSSMIRSTLLIVVSLLLFACSDSSKTSESKDGVPVKPAAKAKSPTDKLEATTVGEFKAHKFGNIYFGAQPSEEDLAQLKAAGVKTVINLRMEGENTKFDEAKALGDLGYSASDYHNPGFNSAATLSDPIFRRVRDLLTNKSNEPILVHCASGNRVGAIWLAHRVLDDGVPYEKALEEAKAIGMKPEAFEARVKAYIESKPE